MTSERTGAHRRDSPGASDSPMIERRQTRCHASGRKCRDPFRFRRGSDGLATDATACLAAERRDMEWVRLLLAGIPESGGIRKGKQAEDRCAGKNSYFVLARQPALRWPASALLLPSPGHLPSGWRRPWQARKPPGFYATELTLCLNYGAPDTISLWSPCGRPLGSELRRSLQQLVHSNWVLDRVWRE